MKFSDRNRIYEKSPQEIYRHFMDLARNDMSRARSAFHSYVDILPKDISSRMDVSTRLSVVDHYFRAADRLSTGSSQGRTTREHVYGILKPDAIDEISYYSRLAGVDSSIERATGIYRSIYNFCDSDYRAVRDLQCNRISNGYIKEMSDEIEQYIRVMPRYQGIVYRGIKLLPEEIEKIILTRPGSTIDMRGTSSWSSRDRNSYIESSNVIFIMNEPKTGVSTTHISMYPDEAEVLLSKDARVVVDRIEYSVPDEPNEYREIHSEEDAIGILKDSIHSFIDLRIYVREE